jgi:hypothetical protein
MSRVTAAAASCLLVLVAGCASATLLARATEVPGAGVRVAIHGVDENIVRFVVYNDTPSPVTVNRDAFRLAAGSSIIPRLPGGLSSVYVVQPGGAQDVNVRFPLAGLAAGGSVAVRFDGAFNTFGRPIEVPPFPFVVQ